MPVYLAQLAVRAPLVPVGYARVAPCALLYPVRLALAARLDRPVRHGIARHAVRVRQRQRQPVRDPQPQAVRRARARQARVVVGPRLLLLYLAARPVPQALAVHAPPYGRRHHPLCAALGLAAPVRHPRARPALLARVAAVPRGHTRGRLERRGHPDQPASTPRAPPVRSAAAARPRAAAPIQRCAPCLWPRPPSFNPIGRPGRARRAREGDWRRRARRRGRPRPYLAFTIVSTSSSSRTCPIPTRCPPNFTLPPHTRAYLNSRLMLRWSLSHTAPMVAPRRIISGSS